MFTRDWSDAIPVDHTLIPNVPSSIRAIRVDLEDRLAGVISGFISGDTAIGVLVAPFIAQSTPSPVALQIQVYGKQFSSKTELTVQDADSNEIQLTKLGKINSAELSTVVADLAPLLAVVYPIGSTYCNVSDSTNPATLFGFGTWIALGGVVLAGYESADANFGTPGATVGEPTHTLSTIELPAHSHTLKTFTTGGGSTPGQLLNQNGGEVDIQTQNAGGGGPHNNIQLSLTVYMWQRTS